MSAIWLHLYVKLGGKIGLCEFMRLLRICSIGLLRKYFWEICLFPMCWPIAAAVGVMAGHMVCIFSYFE